MIRADGTLLRGGEASLYVFQQCGQRWARLAAAKPFRWPVDKTYRLIAANRGLFARFLFKKKDN